MVCVYCQQKGVRKRRWSKNNRVLNIGTEEGDLKMRKIREIHAHNHVEHLSKHGLT